MLYQTPSGRTIEISLEQYLDMSDAELNYLNAYPSGDDIDDPWFGSVLTKSPPVEIEDFLFDESTVEDLTTIAMEEKLINPDLDLVIENDD